ncbi:MAG: hypothetical protein ACOCR1_05485, partial [Planctomycetota bacterium]
LRFVKYPGYLPEALFFQMSIEFERCMLNPIRHDLFTGGSGGVSRLCCSIRSDLVLPGGR